MSPNKNQALSRELTTPVRKTLRLIISWEIMWKILWVMSSVLETDGWYTIRRRDAVCSPFSCSMQPLSPSAYLCFCQYASVCMSLYLYFRIHVLTCRCLLPFPSLNQAVCLPLSVCRCLGQWVFVIYWCIACVILESSVPSVIRLIRILWLVCLCVSACLSVSVSILSLILLWLRNLFSDWKRSHPNLSFFLSFPLRTSGIVGGTIPLPLVSRFLEWISGKSGQGKEKTNNACTTNRFSTVIAIIIAKM